MDQIENVSKLDTVEAAEVSGAGCCVHSREEIALSLFSKLTFREKMQLVQMLERAVGQKENT